MNNIKSFGIILIGMMIVALCPMHDARAACLYNDCAYSTDPASNIPSNCTSAVDMLIGGVYETTSCTACQEGTLTEQCYDSMDTNSGMPCTVRYYTCECASCDNTSCRSDQYNFGSYTMYIDRECQCSGCVETNNYSQCNAGYYGTAPGNCSVCPKVCGYDSTSSAGASSTSGCCINESGNDAYGHYTITECAG